MYSFSKPKKAPKQTRQSRNRGAYYFSDIGCTAKLLALLNDAASYLAVLVAPPLLHSVLAIRLEPDLVN